MTKKAAIEFARRESHTKNVRVLSWHKERIASVDGKGAHEIALLIWEYDSEANWKIDDGPHTWTRVSLFVDDRPSFGGYVGD